MCCREALRICGMEIRTMKRGGKENTKCHTAAVTTPLAPTVNQSNDLKIHNWNIIKWFTMEAESVEITWSFFFFTIFIVFAGHLLIRLTWLKAWEWLSVLTKSQQRLAKQQRNSYAFPSFILILGWSLVGSHSIFFEYATNWMFECGRNDLKRERVANGRKARTRTNKRKQIN